MTRRSPFRSRLTQAEAALIAALPIQPPPSRTALESQPAELKPILDPFPFGRDTDAERALYQNRRLDRTIYTARLVDPEPIRTAARLAGWTEKAPDYFELTGLAVLLIRTAGQPTAALVVEPMEAMHRYNVQHIDDPAACLWPNVEPQRPAATPWHELL